MYRLPIVNNSLRVLRVLRGKNHEQMAKERIDKLLFERGLAESRTQAQALILAGQVLVNEQRVDKPGHTFPTSCEIRIKGEPSRYASRGGLKLEAALRQFHLNPANKTCLDVGASTGGFTDCLLQHGATQVWAVDVGHNQLAWKIRSDARVTVIEGLNARHLADEEFGVQFDFVTIDVSFISLKMILPGVKTVLKEGGDCVALIKPQFEVGRGEVGRGGIVNDPAKHQRVVNEVTQTALEIGLQPVGVIESPILGAEGNHEFLIHMKKCMES
jgi:23S rRNA (cytidine1920-2'-O)/16S rRNA (cytidine1409-2'-O)-methyltransferase